MDDVKAIQSKWNRRYETITSDNILPAQVLREYGHLLPTQGEALDLACGLGGNAFYLARAGLHTLAWDISPVAITRLELLAQQQGLILQAAVRDVIAMPPAKAAFDVIVVSYFLQRELMPAICAALRPGGLLFYQTFTRDKVTDQGPSNPQFLLEENELLRLCSGLRVRAYREEGCLGDVTTGLRNEALMVAQA